MNCETCQKMAEIKAALAPCQNCNAGRLHGEVYAVTAAAGDAICNAAAVRRDSCREAVTLLPPEHEDRLRKFFSDIAALSPIEILLLHHALNGGSLSAFRRTLAALRGDLAKLNLANTAESAAAMRQRARRMAADIVANVPRLSDFFAGLAADHVGSTLAARRLAALERQDGAATPPLVGFPEIEVAGAQEAKSQKITGDKRKLQHSEQTRKER